MILQRLSFKSISPFCQHCYSYQITNRSSPTIRPVIYSCRRSKTQLPGEDDLDSPIKYSSSEAAKWTAKNSYGIYKELNPPPRSQGLVISLSVAVFLIYFCILREENDIDEQIWKAPNNPNMSQK